MLQYYCHPQNDSNGIASVVPGTALRLVAAHKERLNGSFIKIITYYGN